MSDRQWLTINGYTIGERYAHHYAHHYYTECVEMSPQGPLTLLRSVVMNRADEILLIFENVDKELLFLAARPGGDALSCLLTLDEVQAMANAGIAMLEHKLPDFSHSYIIDYSVSIGCLNFSFNTLSRLRKEVQLYSEPDMNRMVPEPDDSHKFTANTRLITVDGKWIESNGWYPCSHSEGLWTCFVLLVGGVVKEVR